MRVAGHTDTVPAGRVQHNRNFYGRALGDARFVPTAEDVQSALRLRRLGYLHPCGPRKVELDVVACALVLLRHGQSVYNRGKLFTGWADPDLTNRGREEVQACFPPCSP